MKKLELMQRDFLEWFRKTENTINNKDIDFNSLIEKKLIEIANKNGYEFITRLDDSGPDHIFLIFQNKKNLKFISAYTNEEGFDDEELDHIDLNKILCFSKVDVNKVNYVMESFSWSLKNTSNRELHKILNLTLNTEKELYIGKDIVVMVQFN